MPRPDGGPALGREQLEKLVYAELVVYRHEAGTTLVVQNSAFGHRLGGPKVGTKARVVLRVSLDAEALTEIHSIRSCHSRSGR